MMEKNLIVGCEKWDSRIRRNRGSYDEQKYEETRKNSKVNLKALK
jgi:hypothetical protein